MRKIDKLGRNWTYRLTRAEQDAVSDEAVTLVGDRNRLTVEAEVSEGGIVPKPPLPPTKTDRGRGEAVRTVRTEVGRRKKNGFIGGMEK